MAGMRGYCVAFLAAFDKHWNLALEDVREVWTRRKRRKVPALGEVLIHTHIRRVANCSDSYTGTIQTHYRRRGRVHCSIQTQAFVPLSV
jgi:hypothetical protein